MLLYATLKPKIIHVLYMSPLLFQLGFIWFVRAYFLNHKRTGMLLSVMRSRSRHNSTSSASSECRLEQLEAAFNKLSVRSCQSFTVRHYDGSESFNSVSRYRDRIETELEIRTTADRRQQHVRETASDLYTGKTRQLHCSSKFSLSLGRLATCLLIN